MRFSIAATAALVAGTNAYAYKNSTSTSTAPAYVTEVVTAYTTYCPEPTKITHGGKTYTVTKATTLTITDCPCTVTKPAPPHSTPVYTPPVVVVPSKPAAPGPGPYKNETTSVYVPAPPAGTAAPTKPAPPAFTGAANKAFAASGAGLAAIFGAAAYLL
jgi:hypothetical protein